MEKMIYVNRPASRTWNRLGVNEAAVRWDTDAEALLSNERFTAVSGKNAPLRIEAADGGAAYGRRVYTVTAEAGAELTVFEVCTAAQPLAAELRLTVAEGAHLRVVQLLNPARGAVLRHELSAQLAEHAKLDLISLQLGDGAVYADHQIALAGDGAALRVDLGYLARRSDTADIDLTVEQLGKSTVSEIHASGALMERAKKVFRGTIDFKRGSAGSVGSENEIVLLLGEDAENKTVPVILCAEENVEGSHGATIGELDAEREFYTRHNANPLRGLYPLSIEVTEALESARAAVARFLGAAQSEEIVFTRNTTEGLNLVAYSYGLSHVKAGDEILISTMEHHSNILPWQMVCRQTGAQLKFMECEPDGSLDLNKVEALITARTRVVALQQVSNVLGREYPIRAVAELAHRVGAVLVVDGAQSMPHLPVNVQELGADFLAFSGHKLYGPMGIGALYGRRELLEEMPPFLTGGEMIESVTREGAVFAEVPHKFEAGTVNAAGAAGLHAAIDYVERVGFDTIHARELAVTADALARMRVLPHVRVLGSDKAEEHNGILTFAVDNVHPHDVSELLAADGVAVRAGHHCAEPLHRFLGYHATVRASFAFYNDKTDVDRLVSSLSTVRGRMGYDD